MRRQLKNLVLIFVLASTPMAANGIRDVLAAVMTGAGNHIYAVRACGTLMHIPYVLTLDSKNPQAVRLAGLLAALPTDCKLAFKFFEQCDDRFFKIMLWDVPKFAAYSGAATYDVLNVLNPEHMIEERKSKGDTLHKLKIDQAVALSVEFVLRVLACVASYKAADHAKDRGGADLNFVAALTSEIADCAELSRLIGRYNSYATVPGCDIRFNFEVNHDSQDAENDTGTSSELSVEGESALLQNNLVDINTK